MIQIEKRKIIKCILLSIVTFGIYDIYWMYLLVKNVKSIKGQNTGRIKEMLCIYLVPFYSFYWWYTRGKEVKKEFIKRNHGGAGNEIIYLILDLLGYRIISMAVMQRNFNILKAEEKWVSNWWVNHKPTKRRIIQLYAALLTNANLKGFVNGRIYQGPTKNLCVPGMNCYSCPGAVGSCPLGSLQNALSVSDTRLPAYIFGIIILFGLLLGRTICGFLCPAGLLQELVYKIKTPKVKKNKVTRVFSYTKYVLLIFLVVLVPILFQAPGFCEYICPVGTFEGGVGLLSNVANEKLLKILGPLFTWKFMVLVLVVVGSIFFYRFFCRFLCPLGALYGFFCRIALLGIKLDKDKCTDCGLCISACEMDIKHVGDHECIHCGKCISVCPTKAIRWKGSKLFVRGNDVDMPTTSENIKPLSSRLNKKENTDEEVK